MWLSSICLHAVCVCVCVSVQKPLWFCIFTCNLLCGLLFFFFFSDWNIQRGVGFFTAFPWTNTVIQNPEWNAASGRPQLSHPTCSLAQTEVRGSGRGELWHAGTEVHRGRHTGIPAGSAPVLLAHRLLPSARAGRTLWSTTGPVRILCTHKYTHSKLWTVEYKIEMA